MMPDPLCPHCYGEFVEKVIICVSGYVGVSLHLLGKPAYSDLVILMTTTYSRLRPIMILVHLHKRLLNNTLVKPTAWLQL